MEIRMDGRVALITGGSKGLGLAMARTFAASGASVGLVARGRDSLDAAVAALARDGLSAVKGYSCDVTQPQQIAETFAAAEADFGKVDIVVNNAGTSRTMPFEDATDEIWQEDLDLKLFAAIRLTRLAWPGMKARRWGRVINVLNTMAKAPKAGSAPTSVTRAAGLALTKVLAGEGAPHNILVNAMLVGVIVSDQWEKRHAATASDISFEEFTRKIAHDVPLGRMGTAQEFANLACLLASDAGSYIAGTAINVDGGRAPVV